MTNPRIVKPFMTPEHEAVLAEYAEAMREVMESVKDVAQLVMDTEAVRFAKADGFGAWVNSADFYRAEGEYVTPRQYFGMWNFADLPDIAELKAALVNLTRWVLSGESCPQVVEWDTGECENIPENPTLDIPEAPIVAERVLVVRIPWRAEIDNRFNPQDKFLMIRARLASCPAEWLNAKE